MESVEFLLLISICLPVCTVMVRAQVHNEDINEKENSVLTKTSNEFPEFCLRSEYLDRKLRKCKPCPDNHFMPDTKHTQVRCYPCSRANQDDGELEIEQCTKKYDAIIGCVDGYYVQLVARYNNDFLRCVPCTVCNETSPPLYQIRSCGKSMDTVCCSDPTMVAVRELGEPAFRCPKIESPTTMTLVMTVKVTETPEPDVSDTEEEEESVSLMRARVMGKKRSNHADKMGESNDYDADGNLRCRPGAYLKFAPEAEESDGEGHCETCPDGFSMPQEEHYNSQCLPMAPGPRMEEQTENDCSRVKMLIYYVLPCLSFLSVLAFLIAAYTFKKIRNQRPKADNTGMGDSLLLSLNQKA